MAIKRPHQRRLPAELAERFAREARAAAQLQHRHIVGTYEVGEVDGRPYIASEYIVGTDLAARAKAEKDQNRLLPPRDIALLCAQVAEALHVAHEAGIVHRDLKPANILIGRLGLRPDPSSNPDSNRNSNTGRDGVPTYGALHPYITDFGMAKRDTEAEFVMTQAGQLLGSPAYMSPEQWQDSHAVDRRTDLWAVGVILFELLTGEFPFRASRDFLRLKEQILHADPPPPSQLNSQVPADLDTLCLKCLEKDPSRRFPTAAALAQELHRFLHGEPIHSRPITQWERARKWCQRNPTVASAELGAAQLGRPAHWRIVRARRRGRDVRRAVGIRLIAETERSHDLLSGSSVVWLMGDSGE